MTKCLGTAQDTVHERTNKQNINRVYTKKDFYTYEVQKTIWSQLQDKR